MSLNLASILCETARALPDATALMDGEARWSYRDVAREVELFAAHLRSLGITPGQQVAVLLPNSPAFTVAYFGILHAGATVVPLSFLSVAREIAFALEDSECIALVSSVAFGDTAREAFEAAPGCHNLLFVAEDATLLPLIDAPVDRSLSCDLAPTRADDRAVILYTSGTTGQPKGAELTHFNMWSNAQFCGERLLSTPVKIQTLGPGQVVLAALPLFHSYGQTCNQNSTLLAGGTLTYMRRFSPEAALEVIRRDGVTVFSGVPTMYLQLLEQTDTAPDALDGIRHCFSGGAPLPRAVIRTFTERYGITVLEGYGLSETSPVATFSTLEREHRPGSIGHPIFGCDVRVFDEHDHEVPDGEIGEIVIRGYNVMKGYYNRPEATREALRKGWFHSGDLGKRDADGYLYVVDRKKDMILRGGFNVYPREVEEILYRHPDVLEVVVVGVPDDIQGEEIKAYVALKSEAPSGKTDEQLLEYCRQQLGATKYPRLFEFLPSLPKGPTGKILRRELRERARREAEA